MFNYVLCGSGTGLLWVQLNKYGSHRKYCNFCKIQVERANQHWVGSSRIMEPMKRPQQKPLPSQLVQEGPEPAASACLLFGARGSGLWWDKESRWLCIHVPNIMLCRLEYIEINSHHPNAVAHFLPELESHYEWNKPDTQLWSLLGVLGSVKRTNLPRGKYEWWC